MKPGNRLESLKTEIENRFSEKYEKTDISGRMFFKNSNGIPFHVVNLGGFRQALVIEYADTWEDGDLFYPEDYDGLDDMFEAMVREIESADPMNRGSEASFV